MSLSSESGLWHGVVEYSHAVIEQVRVQAVNGFNSFGHGGLEIGGVLYGERRGDLVRVLAAAELPCDHALGPGFVLSERDQAAFRELMKAPAGMRAVGWYCSHTRSGIVLNANDCAIMERFFERGNIALIVKPTRFGPVEATFHVHGCAEAGPHFSVLVARGETPVEPRAKASGGVAEMEQPEDSVPSQANAPVPRPNEQAPLLQKSGASRSAPFRSGKTGGPFKTPLVRWVGMGILFALIGAWYISTRPAPQAAPRVEKVGLRAYNIADKQVRIEWDRQAVAIRSASAGTLEIVDGASKYSLPLSPDQLRSSSLTYGRQTDAVSVRLRLPSGAEESVQMLVPAAPAAAPSAAPQPPEPAVVHGASLAEQPEPKRVETPPATISATIPATGPQAERRAPLKRFVLAAAEPPKPHDLSLPDVTLPDADAPPSQALAVVPKLPMPLGTLSPSLVSAPPPVSRAPRSGRMIWTGSLGRRGVVEFEGSTATIGSMSGGLPGVAAKLSVSPAEFGNHGLVVYVKDASRHNRTEAPGPLNGWNRLQFVWDPERSKQISVLESPNANNQFARLALRNDARSCSVIVVEWTTQ